MELVANTNIEQQSATLKHRQVSRYRRIFDGIIDDLQYSSPTIIIDTRQNITEHRWRFVDDCVENGPLFHAQLDISSTINED
jgi:hypothetical protein